LSTAYGNTGGVAYRHWAHQAPRAVFLLVHGLGAHAGRWHAAGDFFLKHGISSYAVELKEHGRASSAGFGDYRGKIFALREIALKEAGATLPIFLIGESLGAVLSSLVCAENPDLFKGMVCISPAFKARYRIPLSDALKILTGYLFRPEKEFPLPFDSSMCTRDPECSGRLDRDPSEYRATSAGMIFQILKAQAGARKSLTRIMTPSLFLVAGNDLLIDPRSIRDAFKVLVAADKEIIEFPGMYHALSIDAGKEKVFGAILEWADRRMI